MTREATPSNQFERATAATRVPIRFPVQILVGREGATILGTACTVSRTEIKVLAPPAAAEALGGEGVAVRLSFTPGPRQLVEVDGVVVRTATACDHRGTTACAIEIAFTHLTGKMEASLRGFISQWRPIALLTGFDESSGPQMHAALSMLANVAWASSTDDVLRYLDAYDVAVLCVGPGVAGARELIERIGHEFPQGSTRNVVVAAGTDPSSFTELIEGGQVYYASAASTPQAEVGLVAQNAVREYIGENLDEPRAGGSELAPEYLTQIVDLAERLALQSDAASIGRLVFGALQELVGADRAYFLVCDHDKGTLWTTDEGGVARQTSLAAGIVGFVARTGIAAAIDDVSRDARYHQAADDPQGIGHERFVAEAVAAEGWADLEAYADPAAANESQRSRTVAVHREAAMPHKRVLAVLAIVRDNARPMFSSQEQQLLRMVASQVESTFSRIDMQQQLAQLSHEQEMLSQRKALRVFREEALEHYAKGQSRHGEVLRAQTGWMRWTYPVVLLVALAALLFGIFGQVREYAAGPAIVIIEGRTLVTAVDSASVADVWVRPGDQAKVSQILVSLHHDQELAEYNRINRDYEAQLAKLLREPADKTAQQALLALKSQRVRARRQLSERFLRAPHDGVIGDVRARPGQRLTPGDIVLTMQGEQARYKLVAMLPGAYRPLLATKMKLRLALSGYPNASQQLVVASVGDGVISPNEARRYLGRGIGDAVKLGGSVFVVEAPLRGTTFTFQGHEHRFFDGMYGEAEVVVRSEPLLVKLIPGLKGLWGTKK